MNRDDIIRMALEAGYPPWITELHNELERFAALVAAAEREECAKVCDAIDVEYDSHDVLATWCAAAIRARGQDAA
jgi:hypothetical protein